MHPPARTQTKSRERERNRPGLSLPKRSVRVAVYTCVFTSLFTFILLALPTRAARAAQPNDASTHVPTVLFELPDSLAALDALLPLEPVGALLADLFTYNPRVAFDRSLSTLSRPRGQEASQRATARSDSAETKGAVLPASTTTAPDQSLLPLMTRSLTRLTGLVSDLTTRINSGRAGGDGVTKQYVEEQIEEASEATRQSYENLFEDDGGSDGSSDGGSSGSPSAGSISGAIQFGDGAGGFLADGSNLFWDSANNRLGIGTSTPDYLLDVAGTIRADSIVSSSTTIGGDQTIDGSLTVNADTQLGDDASADTTTFRSRIASAITPATDALYDLGTSALRWSSGFFADLLQVGTLQLRGGSITDTGGAIDFGNEDLSTGGSLTVDGRVGIGTTTPDSLLHVDGGNVTLTDGDGRASIQYGSGGSAIELGTNLDIDARGGLIGLVGPVRLYNRVYSYNDDLRFDIDANSGDDSFIFTGGNVRVDGSGQDILNIGTGDKRIYVGEGTDFLGIGLRQRAGAGDFANELFTSSGSLNIKPNSGDHARVILSGAGDFMVNTDQLYVDTSNSNVGIGTSTPGEKLTLVGGDFLHTAAGDPVRVGLYSNESYNMNEVYVTGDYAYVAALENGLLIFDISVPSNPTLIGSYGSNRTRGVYVAGPYAYLAETDVGLLIIDVSDPSTPTLVGQTILSGFQESIYVSGPYAYVASGDDGIHVVDISDPTAPTLIGTYNTSGDASDVYVAGQYAYVANGSTNNLVILDISEPSSPSLVSTYDPVGGTESLYVSGTYLYLATGYNGLHILNISDPSSPTLVSDFDSGVDFDAGSSVHVAGDYAYVANNADDSLHVLDISDPFAPTIVGSYALTPGPGYVYVAGSYAYVTSSTYNSGTNEGLHVLDIEGVKTPTLYTGSAKASNLTVTDNATILNNLYIGSGLNVGLRGIFTDGDITSAGILRVVGTGTSTFAGAVGIGTSTPAQRLEVVGTIRQSGAVGCDLTSDADGDIVCSASDKDLKTKTGLVTDPLALVSQLNPLYFRWDNPDQWGDGEEIGFFAQDVEKVLPGIVSDTGEYLSLDYSRLTALNTAAIQELNRKIAGQSDSTTTTGATDSSGLLERIAQVVGGFIKDGQLWFNNLFAKTITVENTIKAKRAEIKQLCVEGECLDKSELKELIRDYQSDDDKLDPASDPDPSSGDESPSREAIGGQGEAGETGETASGADETSTTTATTTTDIAGDSIEGDTATTTDDDAGTDSEDNGNATTTDSTAADSAEKNDTHEADTGTTTASSTASQ